MPAAVVSTKAVEVAEPAATSGEAQVPEAGAKLQAVGVAVIRAVALRLEDGAELPETTPTNKEVPIAGVRRLDMEQPKEVMIKVYLPAHKKLVDMTSKIWFITSNQLKHYNYLR